MNGHGGYRRGAGRKKGSLTLKTQEVALQAVEAGGITPLEVMLEVMRAHHAAGRMGDAAAVARWAAPYIHPRLSTVELTGTAGAPLLDLEAQRRALGNADARRHLAALSALANAATPVSGRSGGLAEPGPLADSPAPGTN